MGPQRELLGRGLTFVLVPQSDAFHRRLKLLYYFGYENNGEKTPFTAASNWELKMNTIYTDIDVAKFNFAVQKISHTEKVQVSKS